MKLLIATFCASLLTSSFVFAEEGKCDKCPGEKKADTTLLAEKCEKGKCDKDKKESTLLAEDCEKGKCDKEKKESTLFLANCKDDKCKKDKEEKKESTLLVA